MPGTLGGGGGGGARSGRFWEGRRGGGGGRREGHREGRFPGGWGVSGTSEQLGMWPMCDPTVRTAPSHKSG